VNCSDHNCRWSSLQREYGPYLSHDGWAVGGDATLFSTGEPYPIATKTNPLMNNGFSPSPWKRAFHGANFGIADGSVKFLNTSMDNNIFSLLAAWPTECRTHCQNSLSRPIVHTGAAVDLPPLLL